MIEILKEMVEAFEIAANGGGIDFYAYAKTGRQAIAKLESQDDGYCQACDGALCTAKKGCVALSNPSQRKPLTDGDFLDWYDSAIWGNEDFEQCCQIAFEAGWQFAHGIKE